MNNLLKSVCCNKHYVICHTLLQTQVERDIEVFGKSENIKAMVTAGVLQGLSETSYMQGMKDVNAQSPFTAQLQKNVINNTSGALVNHAINGGDLQQQLEQSLKNTLIDTGAAQGANPIGDMQENGKLDTYTHKLAHAIAGCAAGAAKSDDCRSGALGAVVGEITAEMYAPDNTGTPLTQQQKADTIGVAKIMAGVAAAVTGNDVNLAAAAGGNAAENNRLLHGDEEKAIAKKANGDKAEEDRLTKVACAEVKCWEQYPVGSPEREEKFVSVMEVYSLEKEATWVKEQKSQGLFDYTTMDVTVDEFKRDTLPMVGNAVKVVTGTLTMDAGLTICGTTGLGCFAGVPMALFGESNIVEGISGLRNHYDGYGDSGFNPLRSGFNQALPDGWGNTAYDAFDFATTVGALGAQVPAKIGFSDGINRADSIFGVTVPRVSNATLNPLTNLSLPYGTTQATMLYGVADKGFAVKDDLINVVGDNKK